MVAIVLPRCTTSESGSGDSVAICPRRGYRVADAGDRLEDLPSHQSDGPLARLAFLLPNMCGGGAERVALTLIESIVALGHQVELVLMEARGELLALVPEQVRIVDLKTSRVRDLSGPLVRYIRDSRVDAIQVSMWPLTIAAIAASKLARSKARLVVSDHVALSQQFARSKRTLLALRASMRLLYPRADERVCVSQGVVDDLAKLSRLDSASFRVIHNPIPPGPLTLPVPDHVERLWGSAGRRILTVGTLKDQKNHAGLIRAFAAVKSKIDARLLILGEGPLRAPLEDLARTRGVIDDVVFPGFHADPWPFYASADLFVLSSFYEGFGNVIVEAMHAGLPVVSTDCPAGPSEILADGEFGTLVPTGEDSALAAAITAALETEHDREILKERARYFDPGRTAARYLAAMLGDPPAQDLAIA